MELEVTADDDVEVKNVTFRANGTSVGLMTTRPFRMAYTVARGSAGQSLTLTATAADTSGNTGSAQVQVGVIPDRPPEVTAVSPPRPVAGIPATPWSAAGAPGGAVNGAVAS